MASTVVVKAKQLFNAPAVFKSLYAVPSNPAFEQMFTQWVVRYSGFIRRRYTTNASGGGDWPPLAESTVRGRMRGKKGSKSFSRRRSPGGRNTKRTFLMRDTRRGTLVASPRSYQILKDTGSLFASVSIGGKGNSVTRGVASVTYAIGSTGELKNIALAHQTGSPRTKLPQRKILVPPDDNVLRAMQAISSRAVARALRIGAGSGTP